MGTKFILYTVATILVMVVIFGLVIGITFLIKIAVLILVIFFIGVIIGAYHEKKHIKNKYNLTKK